MKRGVFWAEQLARQTIERAKKENRIAVIRCGQTPSGGKHIGNLNDVVRSYFVYKIVMNKGHEARFVHSTDDRDPLKDIPSKLADLNGRWHKSERFPELKDFLGHPLCRVPDPFGCCSSWSEHFTRVWEKGLNALGMFPEMVSNDKYYEQGKFDPYIKRVFEKIEEVGKIVSEFQETKGEDYIPFDAICPKCGVLANISSFDLKSEKVFFVCGGKAIKEKRSEGCGFEGSVHFREGKLQWRFEWPAQWGIEKTTFEPFGKDHFEGSWKSGQVIAKRIYGIEPPIPYVYEFFLVDGQKMSASKGNVYITQDILKVIEPEIFLYFYTKKPGKQRNLSLKNIIMLVEEFENLEKKYFSGELKHEKEKENVRIIYELSMGGVPKSKPLRIPYTYASMIAQIVPKEKMLEKALELLRRSGHIKEELTEENKKRIQQRLILAKNWAEKYADERYKIKIVDRPMAEIVRKLNEKQKQALRILSESLLKKSFSEQELYNRFFETAEEAGIETKELFSAAYLILLGKPFGPRLAPFILTIGQKRVAEIIKNIQ